MSDPRELITRYAAAVKSKDIEAMSAIYAPEVRVFDMYLPWQRVNRDDLRQGTVEWFNYSASMPTITASDVRVIEQDEMCVLSMIMWFESALSKTPLRLTWVAIRADDGWQIVHEHSSVPLEDEVDEPVWVYPE